MTKEQAASISAKLLLNIYGQDLKAAATVIDAEAKVREGNDKGIGTLVAALANARDFIQELINAMIYEQGRQTAVRSPNQ